MYDVSLVMNHGVNGIKFKSYLFGNAEIYVKSKNTLDSFVMAFD